MGSASCAYSSSISEMTGCRIGRADGGEVDPCVASARWVKPLAASITRRWLATLVAVGLIQNSVISQPHLLTTQHIIASGAPYEFTIRQVREEKRGRRKANPRGDLPEGEPHS